MKRWMSAVLGAVAVLALALTPVWAQGPTFITGWAIHHDTSPPLRDIAIRSARPSGMAAEVPIRVRPGGADSQPLRGVEPDGGLQTAFRPGQSLGPTPPPIVSASGLSDDDNAATIGGRIVPPDVNGDIGLDELGNRIYIQYINLIWGIYDDSGALIAGPFAGNSFWQGFGGFCQANNDGDPVVLYDDQAGRWMFSQFSINQGIQCVAVSTTSDPLGPYHRYAFTVTPGGQNDYPKMGVWDDGTSGSSGQSAYTFTLRDFGGAGGSFSVSAGVMERDAMLNGTAAQFVKFSNPCSGADCIEGQLPPHLAGPPPPAGTCPTFWTAVDAAYDDSPFGSDGYRNHTLCANWASINSSTYTEGPLVPAGSNFDRFLGNGFSDCISPVNGGEVLDCLAAFTMFRAQYRWFGSSASVVLNTTVDAGGDRAGVRWAQAQSANGQSGWSLQQDGTYAPADGRDRWMGSIAMDQDGNIALGYSAVSGSEFPSVRYTSRMAGDTPGTMGGGEVICHSGTGAQTGSSNRWGDYSSMSVDPTDDCTFWYTQEYYETTGSFDFNTRICSFKIDGCGGPCVPSQEICDDTVDNDCDGDIDCADDECSGAPDCSGGFCGDGICAGMPDEDCDSCPADCPSFTIGGAVCGNGTCEAGDGENCVNCPSDCNGKQNGRPSGRYCCGDGGGQNPQDCSDPRCSAGGAVCTEIPTGGGGESCCGDLVCEGPETAGNCESDCEDTCSPLPEVCDNGTDDDCDGAIDCADSDCDGSPDCLCTPVGDSCEIDAECCSNKCRGGRNGKTCKAS